MGLYRGGGGGGGATNETMDLCQEVVGSQQIPWLSTGVGGGGGLQKRPWVSIGGRRGYRRDHRPLSGVGGGGGYRRDHGSLSGGGGGGLEKRPWASIRGGGGGYRRDHGSLSGVGGLQTRPWVSIGGRGGCRRDQGSLPGGSWVTADTMGLYKGEGGGAKQILWVSSRGWGAMRGGHQLHLFWWVLSLYSSFDQFPYHALLIT